MILYYVLDPRRILMRQIMGSEVSVGGLGGHTNLTVSTRSASSPVTIPSMVSISESSIAWHFEIGATLARRYAPITWMELRLEQTGGSAWVKRIGPIQHWR